MGNFNPGELREGDVLLYRGRSFVSKLIILLDGGPYSHASIYHEGHILEALANGITTNAVQTSIAGMDQVDAYRFVSSAHFLGEPPLPVEPVADASEWFENNRERYAYEEILLLACLCSTRKLNKILCLPGMALVLRNAMDHAVDVLAKLAAAGKEPVICSELVYRIYQKAGADYRILVRGADVPAMTTSIMAEPEDEDAAAFVRAARDFLVNYGAFKAPARDMRIAAGASFAEAEALFTSAAVADFVTPHDLYGSPNLQRLGTLSL